MFIIILSEKSTIGHLIHVFTQMCSQAMDIWELVFPQLVCAMLGLDIEKILDNF